MWMLPVVAAFRLQLHPLQHHGVKIPIPSYLYLLYPAWWEHPQVLRSSPVYFLAETPKTDACNNPVPSFHNSRPFLLLHIKHFGNKKKTGHVAYICTVLSWSPYLLGCFPIPGETTARHPFMLPMAHLGLPSMSGHLAAIIPMWSPSSLRLATKWTLRDHFSPSRTSVEHFWGSL